MFSVIHSWTNGWVNNQDAGYLRRHHNHYDVTIMKISDPISSSNPRSETCLNEKHQDCNDSDIIRIIPLTCDRLVFVQHIKKSKMFPKLGQEHLSVGNPRFLLIRNSSFNSSSTLSHTWYLTFHIQFCSICMLTSCMVIHPSNTLHIKFSFDI